MTKQVFISRTVLIVILITVISYSISRIVMDKEESSISSNNIGTGSDSMYSENDEALPHIQFKDKETTQHDLDLVSERLLNDQIDLPEDPDERAEYIDKLKKKYSPMKLESYDISYVKLRWPVKRYIKGEKITFTKGYLIRLQGEFIATRSIPIKIFIGERHISEYGTNNGDIYFVIYDHEVLESMIGKMIRYSYGNSPIRNTGKIFETSDFDITALRNMNEVMDE